MNISSLKSRAFTQRQKSLLAIACLEAQGDYASDANIGSWPKGNPNVNYAQYFIGDSYLAPIQPVIHLHAVTNTQPGSAPNEWLEPVDDKQYEEANK